MFSFGPKTTPQQVGLGVGFVTGGLISLLVSLLLLKFLPAVAVVAVPVVLSLLAFAIVKHAKPSYRDPASLVIAFAMFGVTFGGMMFTILFHERFQALAWAVIGIYFLSSLGIHFYAYREVTKE
ncbi:MAG: hypothetical protein Q4D73_04070 [Actinomycetaceae bacterium]|nr:hypothetical protein [Actinomycetaceae bacterium]